MTTTRLLPLKAFLSERVDQEVVDAAGEYRLVTVRLHHQGVVLRSVKRGGQIASRQKRVQAGQLIVSRIDARNGAMGLIPEDLDGAIVSHDFLVFDIDRSVMLPEYLDLHIGTSSFVDACRHSSEGTTNRVRLRPATFLEIPLASPPVTQQRRVVDKVRSITAELDKAQSLRANAIEAQGTLPGSFFMRLLAPRDGWELVSLSEVADFIDNLHSNPVYSSDGVPCIRAPDVGWGSLDLTRAGRTSEEEYQRRTARGAPRQGDVVFVREGDVGRAALVGPDQRFSLAQRVMLLRPKVHRVVPEFLLHQLLSPLMQERQIRPRITGTTSFHLNIGDLRNFAFVLPPLPQQKEIVSRYSELLRCQAEISQLQSACATILESIRRSIVSSALRAP